jgi:uncharacterized membrane protein
MKNRLISLQEKLRTNYWFIPAVMCILALFLSLVTIKLDEEVGPETILTLKLFYVDSPEGARALLSTVASSMITVAGVVFSLTMVVLSLTSQQYGPLILSHFLRDRGNQLVLGIFTATFIYCLLILRTVRGVESNIFIPHISVLTGLGLSIISLFFLIYFIHHVSESIQSISIINRIKEELFEAIDEIFPAKLGHEPPQAVNMNELQQLENRFTEEGLAIKASEGGYLQMIDDEALMQIACDHDVVMQLISYPGRFVIKGQALVRVIAPSSGDKTLHKAIQDTFILGGHRTQTQDVEFIFTQLAAIAVRALSPAINDPYTATMCIDRLSEALCHLLSRRIPSIYRYDDHGKLRVVADPKGFEDLFSTAFDRIRHYGSTDFKITLRLLQTIPTISMYAESPIHRRFLRDYATLIYEESQSALTSEREHQQVNQMYKDAQEAFQIGDDSPMPTESAY